MGSRRSEELNVGSARPVWSGGVRRHSVVLLAAVAPVLAASDSAVAAASIQDLGATYQFLVSDRATQGGALYFPRQGVALPYSFWDSSQYWGEYVCTFPDRKCAVTDVYDPADYALKPREREAGVLQAERVNVHNGTNIYDAAVWQIAVVLGAVVNGFGNSVDSDAYHLAAQQNEVLSGTEDRPGTSLGKNAVTRGGLYRYNDHVIESPTSAYSFRMTAPAWLADDPLMDSRYAPEQAVSRAVWVVCESDT